MKYVLPIFLCFLALGVQAAQIPETTLREIRFDQKINTQIPLGAEFRDETGRTVKLGEYFGAKPVVLVLGYFRCPMLCTLVLNGLIESCQDLKWDIGKEFEVVDVSISPAETPEIAAATKRENLRHYGRPGAEGGWHFLTGDEAAIRQLCAAVGFRYAYDSTVKQYAHPSGFVVLTPQGKVSRYFFGVDFRGKELSNALHEAAANHAGTPIQQLLLLCFHYSPISGKYGALILNTIRGISIATLLGLGVFIMRSVWREQRARS